MCFHFQPCSAYSYILSPFKCQTPEYRVDFSFISKRYFLNMVRNRCVMSFGMWMQSTSVLYIGDVATVSVIYVVSHRLESTIGQQYVVFASGGIPITGFKLTKVRASVVIMDFVFVGVLDWYIVMGCMVRYGSGSFSTSKCKDGKNSDDLKKCIHT